MTTCPDCGYDHCHTRDFLATSAHCPRCSSSFPIANTFVDRLVFGDAVGVATTHGGNYAAVGVGLVRCRDEEDSDDESRPAQREAEQGGEVER